MSIIERALKKKKKKKQKKMLIMKKKMMNKMKKKKKRTPSCSSFHKWLTLPSRKARPTSTNRLG